MSEDIDNEKTEPKKVQEKVDSNLKQNLIYLQPINKEGKADSELRRHINMNEENKPKTPIKLNRTDSELNQALKKNLDPDTKK